MIERLHHRGWHYTLLLGIGAIMFLLNLGGATLWDVDEGRNAECAYEMMQADNWIVPTFNSKLRVDKPALLYWLQIFAYNLFGVHEFSARLPSALAALATVLLAYELARAMFTRTTGLLAGVIVATTPMLCGAARFANPDALLNVCIVLTMTVFWLGLRDRPWWWFGLLGISSGLAVLAKGPVGIVLPGAIAMGFLAWERRWDIAWDWRWFLTCWAFVLTALPWYLWVGAETKGEFLVGFLWRHNVERGTSAMENHHGFPGYYLVVLLVGTAPWSIFLGVAAWFGFWSTIREPWDRFRALWDGSTPERETRADTDPALTDRTAAYRFLACWIVVFLLFFSVAATKLPNYVLPTVVPCALVVARFLQRWRTHSLEVPEWIAQVGVFSLLLIGVAVSAGLTIAGGVGNLAVMRGRVFPGLEAWALLGLGPVLGAALAWWFLRQRQYSGVIVAVAVSAILLFGPLAASGSALFNRYKAPGALIAQMDSFSSDVDLRIGCWNLEHLPSLNFYVKRNIEHLADENAVRNFVSMRLPVYLFLPLADWERLEKKLDTNLRVIARHHDMYHHTEVVVLTNR